MKVSQSSQPDHHDPAFYKFIFDHLPVAITVVDAQLNILIFNSWAAMLTGKTARETIGLPCCSVLQCGQHRESCPLQTRLTPGQPSDRLETTVTTSNGRAISVRMNLAGLFDAEGCLSNGLIAFQDISRIKEREHERALLDLMISHDIKSALSVISGFIQRMLRKGDSVSSGRRRQYLQIMGKELTRIESIAGDFIELSRSQGTGQRLHFHPVSLHKEIQDIADVFEPQCRQKRIRLEIGNLHELPVIEADAGALHRLFANLLNNAIKYSPENGKIMITAQAGAKNVVVKFADEGIGIDAADIPRVFAPLRRGKNDNGQEGLGLGLAVVKSIVEGHGGSVEVTSTPGQGVAFHIVLPRQPLSSGLQAAGRSGRR